MQKKLWIFTTMLLAILLVSQTFIPVSAAPGDYTYKVQVMRSGQPVQNAYVRISGVGVDVTGADGIATLDLSDATGRGQGRQLLYRGVNYAAKKGKASGEVADEYNLVHLTVSDADVGEAGGTFAMGTNIYIKLNEVYVLNLD